MVQLMLCLRGAKLTIKQSSTPQDTKQQSASPSAGVRLKLAIKANKWRLALLIFVAVYAYFVTINLGYMSTQWDEMPHLYGSLLLTRGQTQLYLTTYGYYPPLLDLVTTGYMQIFGASVVAGRLAAVTFSLLALWAVFEFCNKMYGPRNALIASILLGTMPGFVWLSRITLLETMLIFFFTLVMFFFYSWVTKNSNKALIFSGIALGIGILAEYEIVVAAIAMIITALYFFRKRLKLTVAKLLIILVIVVLVAAPWFFVVYQNDGTTKFQTIEYVIQSGDQNRPAYSNRFFTPVFYLVEMTWPFNDIPVNPISLPIFILGLCGLALFAYRRKNQDIFLLTWFMAVYVFFTIIPNRQWRYVTPLFPILAISAACFIVFLYSKIHSWKPKQLSPHGGSLKKAAAAFFIIVVALSVFYSSYNAYEMSARDEVQIPIEQATDYLAGHLEQNQSAVIVCAFNLLDQDMFRFYLPPNMSEYQIWQYPELPVDAFTPDFNITEFVNLCEQQNVKYIILYDYGTNTPFYNTTLTYGEMMQEIKNTGMFGSTTDQPFFGQMPNRLFLVRFNENQTGT
jgi:hypothetical protein